MKYYSLVHNLVTGNLVSLSEIFTYCYLHTLAKDV
jgi:hypothetical protein